MKKKQSAGSRHGCAYDGNAASIDGICHCSSIWNS